MRSPARFTLVELMMVVAVVAILAAIAIPMAADALSRAKLSEAKVNLAGIESLEDGLRTNDSVVTLMSGFDPSLPVGRSQRPWEPNAGFDTLGWKPDGDLRCAYTFTYNVGDVATWVVCDVDGDGQSLVVTTWNVDGVGNDTPYRAWVCDNPATTVDQQDGVTGWPAGKAPCY